MNKNKQYASIYGAKKSIRADQFLVELIIQRRADKKGTTLPPRFWSNPTFDFWKGIFASELHHADPLFHRYDAECIIEAYQSYECRNVLSCTNVVFEKVIQEYQRRKDLADSIQEKSILTVEDVHIVPQKTTKQKTRLSKLR